jgi:formylglycine-generating enzyme required for sulfatase activity
LWQALIFQDVRQVFRWIEPGRFLMGSPENETEREWRGYAEFNGSETQHQVTLSMGFWLADIAVTQALWLAVMAGENPSHFQQSPENPVESVSWDDVQLFIDKLNNLLPGLNAQLPSEGQWEYACRGGTATPFAFGENISPELVNYDGNYPYADAEKGVYREKTVPVQFLPANDWGLYEMHGNVWEWCQDTWQENLGSEPVTDPLNSAADAGASRVLRGGSWYGYGRAVRSAFRSHLASVDRFDYIGFRLSLGHTELRSSQASGA